MKTVQNGFAHLLLLVIIVALFAASASFILINKKEQVSIFSVLESKPFEVTYLTPSPLTSDRSGISSGNYENVYLDSTTLIQDDKYNRLIEEIDSEIENVTLERNSDEYEGHLLKTNRGEFLLYVTTLSSDYCYTVSPGRLSVLCEGGILKLLDISSKKLYKLSSEGFVENGIGRAVYIPDNGDLVIAGSGKFENKVVGINLETFEEVSFDLSKDYLIFNEFMVIYDREKENMAINNLKTNENTPCSIKSDFKDDHFDYKYFSLSPSGTRIALLDNEKHVLSFSEINSESCFNEIGNVEYDNDIFSISPSGYPVWFNDSNLFALIDYVVEMIIYDISNRQEIEVYPATSDSIGYLNNTGYHDKLRLNYSGYTIKTAPEEGHVKLVLIDDAKEYEIASYEDGFSSEEFKENVMKYPVNSFEQYTSGKIVQNIPNRRSPRIWARVHQDVNNPQKIRILVLSGYTFVQVLEVDLK